MKNALPGRARPGSGPALALASLVLAVLVVAAFAGNAGAASGQLGPPRVGVRWSTSPVDPCHGDHVRLLFTACECQVDLVEATRDSVGPIVLRLRIQPDVVCVRCVPDTHSVDVGQLAAGMHSLLVRMDLQYVTPPDTTWPASPVHEQIEFAVRPDCNVSGVPYLERVVIENGPPCEGCPTPVCPDDSLDVRLEGVFPHDCVELVNVTYASRLEDTRGIPSPPTVVILYGTNSCLGRPCLGGPFPWTARLRLPPQSFLGTGVRLLPVEGYLKDNCFPDSVPALIGRTGEPFVVREFCGAPDSCFTVSWAGPGGTGGNCIATYDVHRSADVVFRVGSPKSIAGVQGVLSLNTEMLRIGKIEPARPDWVVQASRRDDGSVAFVAFATSPSAAIPPLPPGAAHEPVFRVRVDPSGVPGTLPHQAWLRPDELLAASPSGDGLRLCPYLPTDVPGAYVAQLCRNRWCDANGDGASDVRDLVTLVNCLAPSPGGPACPDVSLIDCDASGAFDLEDVFCCARAMLHGGGSTPPPDTARVAPGVAARFGVPSSPSPGRLDIPLEFDGLSAEQVGAALFELSFPDDRYEVSGVTFTGSGPWFLAHEVVDDRVRLAVIDLSGRTEGPMFPIEQGAPECGAVLSLALKPGARAGGEVTIAGRDFAGADGAAILAPNASARLAIGPVGQVALSSPRPNPFGASTAFTLTLPEAGPVDAGVFDVAGRRVATLLREANAPAGVYTLGWNGADASSGNGRAAGGVYFVRVVTASGEESRKILYLPGGAR